MKLANRHTCLWF